MLDILIKSGLYPDYDKGVLIKGNIGISGNKITYIGYGEPEAKEIIDAECRVVSPGFIDIHMHEENFSEGKHWCISRYMLRQGVTTAVGGNCGIIRQPVKEFKETMKELGGCPINYVILTGYNHYRYDVLGIGHFAQSSQADREKIWEYMRDDLKEGAWGISFGIEYDPGNTTEEIKQAMAVSDNSHLLVTAHYRGDCNYAISAIEEMIELQNSTDKKFQLSHLSSCSAYGQMEDSLRIINKAIQDNPLFNYDTYPYNASSTTIGSTVFEDGWTEGWGKTYGDILLTEEPFKNMYCTKKLFDEARTKYPDMMVVAFIMNEEEIAAAIKNPYGMIASDGIMVNGVGHPRAAGAFPRVLGKYVREEKQLSLMDALRKITFEPAKRLELENRKGVIKVGADADIVIFDPETIIDGPTFTDINIPNKGIDYVIVNGSISVHNNEMVNEKAGKFLDFKEYF